MNCSQWAPLLQRNARHGPSAGLAPALTSPPRATPGEFEPSPGLALSNRGLCSVRRGSSRR